jgi:hypothetical protein
LVAAPRCLESVSTTDVSRHEHPCRNITSEDCPPSAVGKPADVRHRDRLLERGRSWRRGSSDDAGPPCGHPAFNGSALDGAMPASGRPAATIALLRREAGRSTAALSACGGFAESKPSDTSRGRPSMTRARSLNPAHQRLGRMIPFPPEHVNAPTFLRSRCLPLERTCANALSSAHEERLPPLACGGRHRTCSSTFENLD